MRSQSKPKLSDHFQDPEGKAFFTMEKLACYDAWQLLYFEKQFARSAGDGLLPVASLMAAWRHARNSVQRVMEALPPGALRDQMALELQDRDEAMDRLAEIAQAQLRLAQEKEAQGG
jgi:hypothetical protein